MAQYACLHEIGWITRDQLRNYFADGTKLKGLADAHVPGVEATCGSLGHGLSVAVGLAMAAKRRESAQRVFAIVGDGECNEGSIWEAMLLAAHAKLDNLIVVVDANGLQAMGSTDEVLNLGNLAAKFRAFNFETLEVEGHDEGALKSAFQELLASRSKQPKAIIADTVKGCGVSFMAGDNRWHYTRLTRETYEAALDELSATRNIHLRQNIMRTAFSKSLVAVAQADPRIILLTGDHGYALFDEFRRICPQQYLNVGVAEQNMVGVAAGLAKGGFRAHRLWSECIRADACAGANQD